MRWRTGRKSRNIEDRRGLKFSRRTKGSGLGIIVLALVALYFGVDPAIILQGIPTETVTPTQAPPHDRSPEEDRLAEFVSVVLADTEDTWHALFSKDGMTYEEPVLVLFSGAVQSACGFARAAMGPFYCPADKKVYIDLSFYDDLRSRHGAPGDFAQAYVVAHEIGHHVQNLLGISHRVHTARQRAGNIQANRLSVMQELQA
ncbi:MAG: neutral zinc metallopeptidase, partial [Gammaproteobacteria bacterium]